VKGRIALQIRQLHIRSELTKRLPRTKPNHRSFSLAPYNRACHLLYEMDRRYSPGPTRYSHSDKPYATPSSPPSLTSLSGRGLFIIRNLQKKIKVRKDKLPISLSLIFPLTEVPSRRRITRLTTLSRWLSPLDSQTSQYMFVILKAA
jgi:hypothetical protein